MLASALVVLAAAYLAVSLIVLAPKKAGYRHVQHTISEIGEIGAHHQRWVAFGLFLPVGLLLLLVAYLARSIFEPSAALALCVAVGYVVAAFFPCDPGSPTSGSARQAVHNLGGAVEYLGGGFALMAIAEPLGPIFKIAGFVVLGSAIALTLLPGTSVRGLIQRVAEFVLFAALAASVWRVDTI